MAYWLRFGCLLWLGAATLQAAGIVISRSGGTIRFAEGVSITVNGKDRCLGLGTQPKIVGQVSKLPNVRLDATLLKDADVDIVAQFEAQAQPNYLLPQGSPKNAPPDVVALWKSAGIAYRKSQSEKTPVEVPPEEFLAWLPAGTEELVALCQDPKRLEFLGGTGKGFAMQLELIAATVKAYPSDEQIAQLARYVEQFLRNSWEQFERGAAGVEALDRGLKFAALSQNLYPNLAEHQRLREALTTRKQWLDRKVAVLRAFFAARQWDAFLMGYRDFENYQWSFAALMKQHAQALQESMQTHYKSGLERKLEKEYLAAFREFRLASSRQPSDAGIQKEMASAWSDYSRQAAQDRRDKRKQLTAGQQESIDQALHFASRYQAEGKFEDALKSVTEAEAIDNQALSVLLKKSEVLGALREIGKALATLEEYDKWAVDDERKPANELRNELLFQRVSAANDARKLVEKAWAEGAYHRARQAALDGLRAKDDDPDLHYYAGVSSLITRHREEGRKLLMRYLEISNTIDANPQRRAAVRALVTDLGGEIQQKAGEPNWFSGEKLPAGVAYCPVSLAFQARVDHIDGSNKFRVVYEWEGGQLKSITPFFEKADHATGEKKIAFAYNPIVPQVAFVAYDNVTPVPIKDPDEAVRTLPILLGNNPYIDPAALRRLSGQDVAVGVSGNLYFNPFVWEKLHFFRLGYDSYGRVSEAREIERGVPTGELVEFEWSGLQLLTVRGYKVPGGDDSKRVQVYERRLQYQDQRLVAEEIRAEGKASRIKYNYSGDRLVAAICDKDPTLDGRSRNVSFLAK